MLQYDILRRLGWIAGRQIKQGARLAGLLHDTCNQWILRDRTVEYWVTAVRSFHNVKVCYVRRQRIYSNAFLFKLVTYQSFVMHLIQMSKAPFGVSTWPASPPLMHSGPFVVPRCHVKPSPAALQANKSHSLHSLFSGNTKSCHPSLVEKHRTLQVQGFGKAVALVKLKKTKRNGSMFSRCTVCCWCQGWSW